VRVLSTFAGAAAVALLAFGLALGAYNEEAHRIQRLHETTTQARILADSVTAALAFDDDRTAQEYLNALRANPEIAAAALYDDSGKFVAIYAKDGVSPPARPPRTFGANFQGAHVVVTLPVTEGDARLGSAFLETTDESLAGLVARHAGLALLVGMGFLLSMVLAASQMALRRANAALAERADALGEANRELKVQMDERERAEEALRQSQKMEAVGQLTGGVAHDFNNILMVASSGLDLLDRTADPGRRQTLKDGIRQAVDRGASLTRQLLAISRRSALQPEVIELRERIEGMRMLLDRSLREDIEVEVRLPDDLWPVEADPSQLEVALLNIAVNARDAMPKGGALLIEAENAAGVSDGDLSGDYVKLSVTDEGVGISREMLGRIFEPFFTTKGVGKGTGLGLAQVYGFCRASGGDVRVQSELGRGSTVSLYLPRSHEARPARSADIAAPPSAGPASSGPRGRVLLVEDEEGVASLVTEMLGELGYEVVHVSTAAAALRRLQAEPNLDLVFSDMVMPGRMNGMELAQEILRRRPDLPVLLTTGYSDAAEQARAHGLRLLVKPYRLQALAEALADIEAQRTAGATP
jgi:signal transduction histidine kinase/ActR/RegA family two-component response regulator